MLVFLGLLIQAGCKTDHNREGVIYNSKTIKQSDEIIISDDDLISEYKNNTSKANQKYSGEKVKVTGEIFFVGESMVGFPMILFHSPDSTRLMIGVYFEKIWNEKIKVLDEGSLITIEGVVQEKEIGDIIEISGKDIINSVIKEKQK